MKITINHLLITGLILFGFSCKKDNSGSNSDAKLYLAGNSFIQDNNNNSISVASYWNKGQLQRITDQSKNSYAFDILVKGTTVYLAGYFDGKPCYWKNGEKKDLSNNGQYFGDVRSIAVHNGKIYLGGRTKDGAANYLATFWEINESTGAIDKFQTSGTSGRVSDIIVDTNGDVYGVGNDAGKAVYWLNYTLKTLGTGSSNAQAIYLQNGHRFICGTESFVSGTYLGYWKDSEAFKTYSEKSAEGNVTAIYLDNNGAVNSVGTKFISGLPYACYWDQEGTSHTITNTSSEATSVIYTGVNTFIGGNTTSVACYWKNGSLVSLNTPDSYVVAMYLAQ